MAIPFVTGCILLLSQVSFSDAYAKIKFSPASPLALIHNETQTVTGRPLAITCLDRDSRDLIFLSLYKGYFGGKSTMLMYASKADSNDLGTGGLASIDNATGAEVSGNISQRAITLTYTQVSCDHGGEYYCMSAVIASDKFTQFTFDSSDYTITVEPGQANVTFAGNPSGDGGSFMVGDAVTLTCAVDVGTVESNSTKVEFVWQYEDTAGSQQFQNYTDHDDIEQIEIQTLYQKCQTRKIISKLRRNLTIEDSYRHYRCYVNKGNQSFADRAGTVKITQVKSDAVAISFSPPSPLVLTRNETQSGTGPPLAITCSQPGNYSLMSMSLYKNASAGLGIRLMFAMAEIGNNPGTGGLPRMDNAIGSYASGNFSERAITLTYTNAFCEHGGTYTCFSSVFLKGELIKYQSFSKYSVTVGPGQATVTFAGIPSGNDGISYIVGDSVTLTCTVDVGTVESNLTKVDIVWQYEDTPGSKMFQNYPNLDDIDNTETPTLGRSCQTQTRTSKLRRNLTIEDSYRQYRCYITKGGQSYADLAGSVEIAEVKSNYVSPILSFVPQSPLVLTPTDTQTGGTGRTLTITCAQPEGGTLKSLVLTRNSSSGATVTLLYADSEQTPHGTNGVPLLGGNIPGAIASGSLAQRYITLTYSQAWCDHTGIYTCSSLGFHNNLYRTFEASQNYSVGVGPSQAIVILTSEEINSADMWYVVGDVVVLRCTVNVGSVESPLTKVDFVWQYEDTAGSQQFRDYPNMEDIAYTEPPTASQNCQTQTRISTLRRTLTREDWNRQYRCYMTKGGQSYEDLAGSVEITQLKRHALRLSFNPESPLVLTKTEPQPGGTKHHLNITCSRPGKDKIISLSLYKDSTTGIRTRLMHATADVGLDPGTGGLPRIDAATGAFVSGNITQRAITLTYTEPSCEHGGMYTCSSAVSIDVQLVVSDTSSNYTVTGDCRPVNSGQINMAVLTGPSGLSWRLLVSVVIYVCIVIASTFALV